jgi:zinc transport system substrate-binding protein
MSPSILWRNAMAVLCLMVIVGCREATESSSPSPSQKGPSDKSSSVDAHAPDVIVTSEFLRVTGDRLLQGKLKLLKIVPETMVSPNWRPRRAEIETLRAAKVIVMNGAGFEPWQDRVSLPGSRVVDSSDGYKDQLIRIPDAVTHQHGPDGPHSHAGYVWATWLDPALAAAQLTEFEKAVAKVAPELRLQMGRETAALKAQLESINQELEILKSSVANSDLLFVADSPAVMYLTRRLGVDLKYLHWQDQERPTDADHEELRSLSASLAQEKSRRFLLLNQRCPETVERWCREAGFSVVRVDVVESAATPGMSSSEALPTDVIQRLRDNVSRLRTAIATPASQK